MFKTRYEWAILTLAAALLGAFWIFSSREDPEVSQSGTLTEAPVVGHLAPSFTAFEPDGARLVLDDVVGREDGSGQPVVLNFWASWCGPCRIEMPHLERASEEYAGRAAIWGINQAEPASTIRNFGQEMEVSYPLLVDEDWTINRLYGVVNLPTTIFVDGAGVVQEVFVGTMSRAVLESKIEGLLKESANAG